VNHQTQIENENQAIDCFAAPLYAILATEGVTELCYNGSGDTVYVDTKGLWSTHSLPNAASFFTQLSTMAARNQPLNRSNPLLSTTLPGGQRIQTIMAPCVDTIAVAIRKPATTRITLDDYDASGFFDNVAVAQEALTDEDAALQHLFTQANKREFMETAVKMKKNILISGGTGSGKTTLFNALLQAVPSDERLISIEDSREIKFDQGNHLCLTVPKNNQDVTYLNLLEACLRLRPDRIFAAEIRGVEAFAYLRSVNTAHPGCISTIHANSPMGAIEQLQLMLAQANLGLTPEAITDYVKNSIDIIFQISKAPNGMRKGTQIWYKDAYKNNKTLPP